jgi:hypothetical protein
MVIAPDYESPSAYTQLSGYNFAAEYGNIEMFTQLERSAFGLRLTLADLSAIPV